MLLSKYFLPTLKDNPAEAVITSHRLMLRSGMIRQSSAGIYTWLPLGIKVLQKVSDIVRDVMNEAGAVEMLMPTVQSADLWRESGRYDAYGAEMLRISDRHNREMLYGPTNEELITAIFRDNVKSYRNLPLNLYQIQWKFRDEIRPRFGLMRGREFLMKDAYSFDLDKESSKISYQKMFIAYLKVFEKLGVKAIPMKADTGPIGGDMSHEFLILADTGESKVFCHKDLLNKSISEYDIDFNGDLTKIIDDYTSNYAATEDMHNEEDKEVLEIKDDLIVTRGIEVGHIFYFGKKYSEAMNAYIQGKDGEKVALEMGSYGIGVSRVIAAIIEAHHDDFGIKWPESVAPFKVGIINLRQNDTNVHKACLLFYNNLTKLGVEVLYDDRDERAGVKFADMDLIGLPYQVVFGPDGVKNNTVKIKNRTTDEKFELSIEDALKLFAK